MSVFNLKLAVDVDMLSRWLGMSGLALELWDLSVRILPQGAGGHQGNMGSYTERKAVTAQGLGDTDM